jgi:hypothetical protein
LIDPPSKYGAFTAAIDSETALVGPGSNTSVGSPALIVAFVPTEKGAAVREQRSKIMPELTNKLQSRILRDIKRRPAGRPGTLGHKAEFWIGVCENLWPDKLVQQSASKAVRKTNHLKLKEPTPHQGTRAGACKVELI